MVVKPTENQLLAFADIAVTFLENEGKLKEFSDSLDMQEAAVVYCVSAYAADDAREDTFQDEWDAAVRESVQTIKLVAEGMETPDV